MTGRTPVFKERMTMKIGDAHARPTRRWRRRLGVTVLSLLGLVVVLLIAGTAYQAIGASRDRQRLPPPGKLYDVGGFRLHIHCTGQGQPTVVLDTGLGLVSPSWEAVQGPVSATTRVCSYDRAGYGWSETGPSPRLSTTIARELHKLLTAAQEQGPFVLVGHSFGGYNVRVFGHEFPSDTAALVLVDSSHEDQVQRMPTAIREAQANASTMLTLLQVGTFVGALRLQALVAGPPPQFRGVAPSVAERMTALSLQPSFGSAVADEMREFERSADAVRRARSFGNRPLVVLTAGLPPEDSGISAEVAAEFQKVWVDELQPDLATLSTRGRRVIVSDSSHMIPLLRPDAVVTAIQEVVATVRSDQPGQSELISPAAQ